MYTESQGTLVSSSRSSFSSKFFVLLYSISRAFGPGIICFLTANTRSWSLTPRCKFPLVAKRSGWLAKITSINDWLFSVTLVGSVIWLNKQNLSHKSLSALFSLLPSSSLKSMSKLWSPIKFIPWRHFNISSIAEFSEDIHSVGLLIFSDL